jgi:tetratricopeptide (TPR) repeat protein
MGDNFIRSQYYGLASGRYHQALYLQPDNTEALCRLAEIDIKIQNYEDAETTLFKVITKDPAYIPALKNLGELMYTLGRYREASEYYGQYIKLAETSEKALIRYVTVLYFNKEFSKVVEYVDRVLMQDSSNPVMLRLKGYSAYELDQNQEGLDAMQKFFEVRSVTDTNKVIATDYEYYGKLLARTGNDSLAIINLVKAMEIDTALTGLLEDIAKLYEKQKKYPEAIQYFEELIQARNENVSSLIYFSMGKDLLLMADNVKGTPDSLLRPAYLEKANLAFSKVVEISPGSYLGYQWRARALAGLDPETTQGLAKADYEKTLSLLESKNDTKRYATELIEAYRYLGYYYYLKYDEIKKSDDAAAKELARTDSVAYWQKVLSIDPSNSVAKQAIAALK